MKIIDEKYIDKKKKNSINRSIDMVKSEKGKKDLMDLKRGQLVKSKIAKIFN
ncbi:MAG: hypothetical protein LBU40_02265 [Methanobrevibacter sp.]|jgi:hypothetical protein|nr:hypothetical protein [Methanobrevibacter sp.]